MPITITVSAAERVRYSVFSGDVTGAELLEAFRRALTAPDFDPTLNGLVDMRAVRTLDVAAVDVWALAEMLRRAERPGAAGRAAIVASSNFAYGMARMFATLTSGENGSREYRAFREMAKARGWLGLAPQREAAAR